MIHTWGWEWFHLYDQIYFPGLRGVNLKQYFASGPHGVVSRILAGWMMGWRPENGTTTWNVDAGILCKEKDLDQPCEKEQQPSAMVQILALLVA